MFEPTIESQAQRRHFEHSEVQPCLGRPACEKWLLVRMTQVPPGEPSDRWGVQWPRGLQPVLGPAASNSLRSNAC
eukprot:11929742-Alexandrium_andersonii.AAC.1